MVFGCQGKRANKDFKGIFYMKYFAFCDGS